MRRIRRLLAIIYTAISLLLCAAVCVLWIRSHINGDSFSLGRWLRYSLDSQRGALSLSPTSPPFYEGINFISREWSVLGFELYSFHGDKTIRHGFAVPHWFCAALTFF